MTPKVATTEAMHEITGAIISITLVMAAVFLPVSFMTGSTGIFYRQFALTMAIAIIISAVNALTLSPALAALLLKNKHSADGHDAPKKGFVEKFYAGFNGSFNYVTNRYVGGLKFLIRKKWLSIGGLVLVLAVTIYLVNRTKTGFIPTEDQGFVAIAVSTPSGTSLSGTNKVFKQAEDQLKTLPSSRFVTALS